MWLFVHVHGERPAWEDFISEKTATALAQCFPTQQAFENIFHPNFDREDNGIFWEQMCETMRTVEFFECWGSIYNEAYENDWDLSDQDEDFLSRLIAFSPFGCRGSYEVWKLKYRILTQINCL